MRELCATDIEDGEVSGVEINADKLKNVQFQHDSWVNRQLDPIKLPIVCRIPQEILITMRTIEQLMVSGGMSSLEFGVYLKGKLGSDAVLVLEPDTYVPKQKVSHATIDFEEDSPPGFNGVIHRHPNGCRGFSGTDFSYINKNFDFSLLYVDNDILLGIINVPYNGARLQLPVNPKVMYPVFGGFDNILEKIEKREYKTESIGDHSIVKRRKDTGGYIPGLSCEDRSDRLTFDDDLLERDDGTLLASDGMTDAQMYQCKLCGETQEIEEFPHTCEGCDKELDQTDVTVIDDLTEEVE